MADALTQADFDTVTQSGVSLIDFWAEWCGPCKRLGPTIDELAQEYAGKATIRKVNIDDEQDLAVRFDVSSIPLLIIMRDGEVREKILGAYPKAHIKAALDKVLAS